MFPGGFLSEEASCSSVHPVLDLLLLALLLAISNRSRKIDLLEVGILDYHHRVWLRWFELLTFPSGILCASHPCSKGKAPAP
jgi:hypothetical protein